jgi:hypothetical protein
MLVLAGGGLGSCVSGVGEDGMGLGVIEGYAPYRGVEWCVC